MLFSALIVEVQLDLLVGLDWFSSKTRRLSSISGEVNEQSTMHPSDRFSPPSAVANVGLLVVFVVASDRRGIRREKWSNTVPSLSSVPPSDSFPNPFADQNVDALLAVGEKTSQQDDPIVQHQAVKDKARPITWQRR